MFSQKTLWTSQRQRNEILSTESGYVVHMKIFCIQSVHVYVRHPHANPLYQKIIFIEIVAAMMKTYAFDYFGKISLVQHAHFQNTTRITSHKTQSLLKFYCGYSSFSIFLFDQSAIFIQFIFTFNFRLMIRMYIAHFNI